MLHKLKLFSFNNLFFSNIFNIFAKEHETNTIMKNRTQEQLKAMFEQCKLEQQKKKKARQQQTLQLRQALYKKADIIIKKAFQEEKKKRLEQLQLLIKQKLKEETKIQRTLPLHIYGQMIERDTNEEELYTLDELKNIEELYPNETGRIRWDVWEKLINEGKKWNEETLKQSTNTLSKQKMIGDATMKRENI